VGLVVGLTSYFSWRNGRQTVNSLADHVIREVSDRVHHKLETYLELPHQINVLNATAIRSGFLDVQNVDTLQKHFWHQLKVFDSLSSIYIGNAQGQLYGIQRLQDDSFDLSISLGQNDLSVFRYRLDKQGKRDTLMRVFPRVDMRQRPWFVAAKAAGFATWSEIYPNYTENDLSIAAVYPLYNSDGELQTVIANDLLLANIHKFLRQQQLGQSGQIFIMERSGKLVSTSTGDLMTLGKDGRIERIDATISENGMTRFAAKRLLREIGDFKRIQDSQAFALEDEEGEGYFLRVVPLQDKYGLNWLMVAVVPESDFMQQIYENVRITVLLCAGALVMAIVLSFLTTTWIIKPILCLSRASRNLALGKWDYPVQENSMIAELEVLTHVYNEMAAQLCQSFDQVKIALQESEQKFTKVFRTSPAPIVIATLDQGLCLEVNESFLQLSGYSRQESIGHTVIELGLWANLEDREFYRQLIQQDGTVSNLEVTARFKSGELKTILLSAEVLELDGQMCVLTVGKDISDRKQTENALKQSEERYRAIVNTQTDMIIRSDPDTTITFVNEATCRLSGYSQEQLLGHPWRQFIHPDDLKTILSQVATLSLKNPVLTMQNRIQLADGQMKWFEWTNQGIFNDQGLLIEIQSVGRDISKHKHVEFLRKFNRHLKTKKRKSSVDLFRIHLS
jgi:PAS domain S-box-containing protein